MNSFSIFFPEGIKHITDLNGIDHILFITALCLGYLIKEWKKLLILVTAFTIGHSITLALSTLNIINFSINLTEFFIALTIFIAAAYTIAFQEKTLKNKPQKNILLYFLALIFGLIHGMGFSTLLKSMLGKNSSIATELFAFNLGIEVGQLIIVAFIILIANICIRIFNIKQSSFILVVSGGIAALALQLAIERFPY